MEQFMVIIDLLVVALIYGMPLLYGTTGEILTEKSGSLNLGVEGTMAIGAIGGYCVACMADSLFVGVLGAFFFAGIIGLIFSFLTVTLKANQNVTGLTITIFGVGLYKFIGQTLTTAGKFPKMSLELRDTIKETGIPLLRDIPVIGDLFFSYNILIYIGIIIAIVVWVYLNYTRSGLKLRSVGENPASADSIGVNVGRYRYGSSIIGSGIMGIGGMYMGMIINLGAWNDGWINGYGWIAIALVVFANWSASKAIFGTWFFGVMIALQSKISLLADNFPAVLGWTVKIPPEFYQMLPFVITALVLIITSIVKKKSGQPSQCGVNYFREDR